MYALMLAPLLGGSFNSFFSTLTLNQIHRIKKDNDLRLVISDPIDFSRSHIKDDDGTNNLIDMYHLPSDLITDSVLKNQDAYYIVSDYQNILRNLDQLGIHSQSNLKKLLVFICEDKNSDSELGKHVVPQMLAKIPAKFHQAIVYLSQLQLSDLKELAKEYVSSDKESKALVELKEAGKSFGMIFANLSETGHEYFRSTILSLENLDFLLVKSNPAQAEMVKSILETIDPAKLKVKNIFIQQDVLDFQEIVRRITLPNCKRVIVINKESTYELIN